MPKNRVNAPITSQEIAFAYLVFSGTMTGRRAAETVGLNPGTADYLKSQPRVRDYMLEHQADVRQLLVEQDTEELRRFNLSRDRVLARLWQIADLAPEITRNSASAQVKALSMIIAIERLIHDRRAAAVQNKPAPLPVDPPFYVSEWMRNQQNGESVNAQSTPGAVHDGPQPAPDPTPAESSVSRPVVEGPAVPAPLNPSQATPSLPRVPMADYFAPDTSRPFTIDKNRFGRRR